MKQNWGRKVAKQQHKQCNEMAIQIAKATRAKDMVIQQIKRRAEARQIQRVERQSTEGTAVMDSDTMSSVIQPRDNKCVIETNVPSNKFFTVATGEQA